MPLFLLRHEEREDSITCNTPLIEIGIKNSETKTIKKCENVNIDTIYCSPFLRCMQTITPYAKKHKIQLNIEYGLMDILLKDFFNKDSNLKTPADLLKKYNVYNYYKYNSIYSEESLKKSIPENYRDLHYRIKNLMPKFMKKIKGDLKNNKNILLVSHCGIMLEILQFFGLPTRDLIIKKGDLINIESHITDNYYVSLSKSKSKS